MYRITPRVLCQQLGWKTPECKSNHSFMPANWCINQEKNRGKNPSLIKAFSHFIRRGSIGYLHGVISGKRRCFFLKDGCASAHQIICNYNSSWATYAGRHRVGDNVRRWIYVDGFIQITWTSCERDASRLYLRTSDNEDDFRLWKKKQSVESGIFQRAYSCLVCFFLRIKVLYFFDLLKITVHYCKEHGLPATSVIKQINSPCFYGLSYFISFSFFFLSQIPQFVPVIATSSCFLSSFHPPFFFSNRYI